MRASDLDVHVAPATDGRLVISLARDGHLLWRGLQDVAGRFETVDDPAHLRGVDPPTGELKWSARCDEIFGLPAGGKVNYETYACGVHPEDRHYLDGLPA